MHGWFTHGKLGSASKTGTRLWLNLRSLPHLPWVNSLMDAVQVLGTNVWADKSFTQTVISWYFVAKDELRNDDFFL